MKKIFCLLLALLLLPIPGITRAETTIVASFYPIYVLAQNVLQEVEGVRLTSMTAPSTGCLHDYQLLTSDMRTLSGATALLINGAGMEGFLPDVQSQFPDLPIVDCSRGVSLICDAGHDRDHDHAHGDENAHIWLDPENAIRMVQNMAQDLSGLLPEAKDKITENADAYIARLEALDAELTGALAQMPSRKMVTFHEAFPYFARAYGLEVVAVVALEPDDPISPRMLAEVMDAVRQAGNPPLFAEPQYAHAALQAISRETGAAVYELDPLVTGDGALTAYEDTMRKNLTVLLEALGK